MSRGGGISDRRQAPDIGGLTSLKIDNLSYQTTPNDLRRVFERYGEIGDVHIPRDKYSRQSKGFGFVRFYERRDAEYALDRTDGKTVDGRDLRVTLAKYDRPSDDRSGGGRGGGGRGGGRGRSRSPRRRSRSPRYSRSRSPRRSRSRTRSPPSRGDRRGAADGSPDRSPRGHNDRDSPAGKSRSPSRSPSRSRSNSR